AQHYRGRQAIRLSVFFRLEPVGSVHRPLAKVGVEGSNPFARSRFLDHYRGPSFELPRPGTGWAVARAGSGPVSYIVAQYWIVLGKGVAHNVPFESRQIPTKRSFQRSFLSLACLP